MYHLFVPVSGVRYSFEQSFCLACPACFRYIRGRNLGQLLDKKSIRNLSSNLDAKLDEERTMRMRFWPHTQQKRAKKKKKKGKDGTFP